MRALLQLILMFIYISVLHALNAKIVAMNIYEVFKMIKSEGKINAVVIESMTNWARLIQKIYHVDPLICPKCQGKMRTISWIEDDEVIEKRLKHLGLWLPKRSPPPRAHDPPQAVRIDYLDSRIPSADDYLIDPDYPIDSWKN